MHEAAAAIDDPLRMRSAGPDLLSLALIDARNCTLRWLAAFEPVLPALGPSALADPPLWLVGHAAWFQEYWIARHVQRGRGEAADRRGPHLASFERAADDWSIELRTRDRQRKLISKIDAALRRIDEGEYGYCEVTGEPISLGRLEARPIATMTLEAQERHERQEKVSRDD